MDKNNDAFTRYREVRVLSESEESTENPLLRSWESETLDAPEDQEKEKVQTFSDTVESKRSDRTDMEEFIKMWKEKERKEEERKEKVERKEEEKERKAEERREKFLMEIRSLTRGKEMREEARGEVEKSSVVMDEKLDGPTHRQEKVEENVQTSREEIVYTLLRYVPPTIQKMVKSAEPVTVEKVVKLLGHDDHSFENTSRPISHNPQNTSVRVISSGSDQRLPTRSSPSPRSSRIWEGGSNGCSGEFPRSPQPTCPPSERSELSTCPNDRPTIPSLVRGDETEKGEVLKLNEPRPAGDRSRDIKVRSPKLILATHDLIDDRLVPIDDLMEEDKNPIKKCVCPEIRIVVLGAPVLEPIESGNEVSAISEDSLCKVVQDDPATTIVPIKKSYLSCANRNKSNPITKQAFTRYACKERKHQVVCFVGCNSIRPIILGTNVLSEENAVLDFQEGELRIFPKSKENKDAFFRFYVLLSFYFCLYRNCEKDMFETKEILSCPL
ncbi:hypothetical protein J437_LFUL018305 [Ladona fulva]|uniref:Uncharacterized protein n=1 Tax=Ladona fulva TaxID=123851 RepID=A0A8K0KSM0_LADFU|nr:hypothetical protein J437_LFUL018305 [Ladona fulva]